MVDAAPLPRREHQKILMRQKSMLLGEPEAVCLHLFNQIFTGDFHFQRRTEGEFFLVEVDHDDFAAGLEHLFQEREILRLILNMVPYIADKKAIDRLIGQQRISRGRRGWRRRWLPWYRGCAG